MNQDLRFEWDEEKNKANKRKHKISFKEASYVFYDDNVMMFYDEAHSNDEDRFIAIGRSKKTNLLLVCYCYRGNDDVIRIISARKAERKDISKYGGA